MSDHLVIINSNTFSNIKAIVFATGPVDPLVRKEELEKYLEQNVSVGTILIDYFLYNGSRKNRYICYKFDGRFLNIASSQILDKVEGEIREIVAKYYIETEDLDLSLLNNAQVFLLKMGKLV